MTIPYTKQPLTVDQQLSLLVSRGMVIADRPAAEKLLSRISYYRFSAYAYPFRIGPGADTFKPGTSFERVVGIYEFDRRLRIVLLEAIERIEVAVRALITTQFSLRYGSFGYTEPANFQPRFKHGEWMASLVKEAEDSKEVFVNHYRSKYEGYPILPFWMAVELVSFGALCFLYRGLKPDLRTQLATPFGVAEEVLATWIHALSYVRNLCAHHCRLLNRELVIKPAVPRKDRRWASPELALPGRMFVVMLVLRSMLRTLKIGEEWASRMEEQFRDDFRDGLIVHGMGMHGTWSDHPVWRGLQGG